ncbi:hypothetical protein HBA54_03740 [Pelagibius litoralis]|uniref:Uncharacterized protein n=1 Tax=Pelagibius litoralis TaxID=374515 RepID=A0A967CAI1_9PROT|nr:hypothetical protein [Pelagibius litoralis]NIA67693.1 hypothetical protein [Pelagibius litoralis]
MIFRICFCVFALGMVLMTADITQAQQRSTDLKATPPPGEVEFPACCDSCDQNGCTGCNSGPEGLTCGSGLIKAECSISNNKVSCEEDTASTPLQSTPNKFQTRQ